MRYQPRPRARSSASGDARPRAPARSRTSGEALAIEPLSNGGWGSYSV
jgi:hypothetical protein